MTDGNLTLYVLSAVAIAAALPWVMPNLFGLRNALKHLDARAAGSAGV